MTVRNGDDPALPEDLSPVDEAMACLADDAQTLRDLSLLPVPEEIIDNMEQAEAMLRTLRDLLDEVRACFTRDDDLRDNLLPRIDAALDGSSTAGVQKPCAAHRDYGYLKTCHYCVSGEPVPQARCTAVRCTCTPVQMLTCKRMEDVPTSSGNAGVTVEPPKVNR